MNLPLFFDSTNAVHKERTTRLGCNHRIEFALGHAAVGPLSSVVESDIENLFLFVPISFAQIGTVQVVNVYRVFHIGSVCTSVDATHSTGFNANLFNYALPPLSLNHQTAHIHLIQSEYDFRAGFMDNFICVFVLAHAEHVALHNLKDE